jgi:hypothetical protein
VNGRLRDKPSKSRDFYHSCYNLSGLSVSQHNYYTTTVVGKKKKTKEGQLPPSLVEDVVTNNCNDVGKEEEVMGGIDTTKSTTRMITRQKQSINCKIFGDVKFNIVGKTDLVINIRLKYVQYMLSQEYSKSKSNVKLDVYFYIS